MVRMGSSPVKTAFRREIGQTLKREFKITERQSVAVLELLSKVAGTMSESPKVSVQEAIRNVSVTTINNSKIISENNKGAIANSIIAMADVGFSSADIVAYIYSYYLAGADYEQKKQKIGNPKNKGTDSLEKSTVVGSDESKISGPQDAKKSVGSNLKKFVIDRPIESWAGHVLKAGEIKEKFGIPTSTLHSWRETNRIVAIKRNHRNFCYPLEQFVDGKPVAGIEDILKLSPSSRSAWLWLCQRHPTTKDMRPIDLLRKGDAQIVVDAAQGEFGCQANG